MFHRRYSNCRSQNSALYNHIICQTVENMSFLERLRLSCILQAFAKGYQGHKSDKSNFGFHVPFDREIRQISDQKSVLDSLKGTLSAHPKWSTFNILRLTDLINRTWRPVNDGLRCAVLKLPGPWSLHRRHRPTEVDKDMRSSERSKVFTIFT